MTKEGPLEATAYRRETCRLCSSTALELVVGLTATPEGDDFVTAERLHEPQPVFPLDVVLCLDCGNAQLSHVVSPPAIYEKYTYVSSISLELPTHFLGYADDLMGRIAPPQGALVVEMGSNEGALLRALKDRGLSVLGVDPAVGIARMATEAGIETLAAYFTAQLAAEIRAERGAATAVLANNVFANIDDLASVIAGVRDLMAPDGVFVMETSYWLDVVDKALLDTIFHEHISYFTAKPLAGFFARHGLELIDVQRVPTKGGSIRVTAQHVGGPRTAAPRVAEVFALEDEHGVHDADRLRVFARSLEGPRREVHDIVAGLVSKGERVAGYGAAVGLTTLVYHYGIGEMLDFLADDFVPKQGRFSPGFHIPVLSPDALYDKGPDHVLLLAWRYAEPIMKNNRRFVDEGGHWIIPMPALEIV